MANKTLWKEAYELKKEYAKHGIDYCYNQRNKIVYLKILNAPTVAMGVDYCQLTGYLKIYGGVIESRDIDRWIKEVKKTYILSWKDNKEMLKFIETVV